MPVSSSLSPNGSFLQARLRRFYHRRFVALSRRELPVCWERPAVVFAPHPDDETLGCGGTILRKRLAGAEVRIVVLTDGASSHAAFLPPSELAVLRAGEARAAAARLGVPEDCVHLLAYPDGRLGENRDLATRQVAGLLRRWVPAEVYLPYRADPAPDHAAAFSIVQAALAGLPRQPAIFEYPVWLLFSWPWVSLIQPSRRAALDVLRNTLSSRLGWRLLSEFTCAIPGADLLAAKRTALACHRSQVERLLPTPAWPILGDIAGGDFLASFFTGYELYRPTLPLR